MFLSLHREGPDQTEISWLLRKRPDHHQTFELAFGTAHVSWPTPSTCALWVDVDPIQLVRGKQGSHQDGPLAQYVNDRPYSASSLLSVALVRVFRSAMGDAPDDHPDEPAPYTATLPVVPSRGGESLLRRLFEPLGYDVQVEQLARDPEVPAWGMSHLYSLTLSATCRLADLLRHLYVLIPVLDDDKHYWVGTDEVAKLLRHGEGWLEEHPAKEQIALRYLKHRRGLARKALEGLVQVDEEDEGTPEAPRGEAALEKPLTLNQVRMARVVEVLAELGVSEVVDLGCGEAKLVRMLLHDKRFSRIVGIDVSAVALERAERRLRLDEKPDRYRDRLTLWTGSATYRDRRLDGVQSIVLVEVIEHMELNRLPLLEGAVFAANRPGHVVVTTPNAEYNALFPDLPAGRFRHSDHRFEWTRREFEGWAEGVAERCGYTVAFEPIGPVDPTHGAPTQLARFSRCP